MKNQKRARNRKRKAKPGEIVGFLTLALFMILIIYIAVPFEPRSFQSTTNTSILTPSSTGHKPLSKVAIVDQLSAYSPDSGFMQKAENVLEQADFSVDIFDPEDVTVNLYASLAGRGYKLIVFRVHAGVNEEVKGHPVGLFTTESYTQFKYQQEQLNDLVGSAQAFNRTETVFAVTPKFIREKSIVDYDDAIVILMGCFGLYSPDLPQAFMDRGVTMIIGWNGLVDLEHTDKATLTLLRLMLLQKMNVEQAVASTMNDIGADSSGSVLGYLPLERGGFTFFEFSDELLLSDINRSVLDMCL